MADALILFVRNPERGKVKTRIAATEGEDFALKIYDNLLSHTHQVTAPLQCTKYVFYANAIQNTDMWTSGFHKLIQANTDLGNRMKDAFVQLFAKGHDRICIIGSDCYELTTEIIEEAFKQLHTYDVVIGPAHDGGYYLLGMKAGVKDLFEEIEWSTDKVLEQTTFKLKEQQHSYILLTRLHDVDTIEDVPLKWRDE